MVKTVSAGDTVRDEPGGARARLVERALDQLIADGRPEQSLRSLAASLGVSHSLLLYHFGSLTALLGEVHLACERREREHLAGLRTDESDLAAVMRAMWRHLADPAMWPVYRLGFALRARADVAVVDQDRQRQDWVAALEPLTARLVPAESAADEALLWLASTRGLLWELVTGADPDAVDRAAERVLARYGLG